MINIKRFGYSDKKLLSISNKIRTTVFVIEQNVDPVLEYKYEEEGNFYLLYYNEKPAATARWRNTEKGIKLERFATLKEHRNKGLGSRLLKEIMKDVLPLNKSIYLHSQIKAITYYEREGFRKKGEMFVEADIEHYLMEYIN